MNGLMNTMFMSYGLCWIALALPKSGLQAGQHI